VTALDDRPVLISPVLVVMADRVLSDARWDAAVRAVGGEPLWMRFSDTNPLTGRAYACSAWEELPGMVGVLARRFVLTAREWDALVTCGRVLSVTGTQPWRIPFTMAPLSGRPLPPIDDPLDVCGDCGGTGLSVDDDVSMTGTRDAAFLCWCIGEPA
jgi:hypothetical protein